MPEVFNPSIPPQEGPSGDISFPNNRDVRFGDGYVASFAQGMNEEVQTWPLTWNGTDAEITPILEFLRSKKSYISFYWTPPFGVQGLYRVKSIGISPAAGGNATLSATLVQEYAP